MPLHTLPKLVRRSKRMGRGIGSRGAKSGRGMKGQKSRAGYHSKAGFEGGQTPLYMRLPKERGAKQRFPSQVEKPVAVTTSSLNQLPDTHLVGMGQLRAAGLIGRTARWVKLIGSTPVKRALTVRVHAATPAAIAALQKAGGKVELIPKS